MTTNKQRITKLEARTNTQSESRLFGIRADGTHYPIKTWKNFLEAAMNGDEIEGWKEFLKLEGDDNDIVSVVRENATNEGA